MTRVGSPIASVVLNDMDRTDYAAYGFRSWMLQDADFPYEVIVNLFNDKAARFESLAANHAVNCCPMIKAHEPPRFFNIAAANNLGLHYAGGRWVLFVNSDIIYARDFLRRVVAELSRRDLHYAVGSRINLPPAATAALRPAADYSAAQNFDFLVGSEHVRGRSMVIGGSAWIVRREIARAVGGFDPQILCFEDAEFNDRVIHYLRRRGMQDVLYVIGDFFGYHMSHPGSELYDAREKAAAIIEARRARLSADASSGEDVIPNDLDCLEGLVLEMQRTEPAPPLPEPSLPARAYTRLRRSFRVLVSGRP